MADSEEYHYFPPADIYNFDRVVLNFLVEKKRLAPDVLVKVEQEAIRRLGRRDQLYDERNRLLDHIVDAALREEPLPGFLSAPLPGAMWLAVSPGYKGPSALRFLTEDYHRFWTFHDLAEQKSIHPRIAYKFWHQLVTEVEPELGVDIETDKNDGNYNKGSNVYGHRLRGTVIKDQPLLEAYDNPAVKERIKTIFGNLGRTGLQVVGLLLLDNHPELIEEVDID